MQTRGARAAARWQDRAVVRWRHRRLTEAGFEPALAQELAGDPRWDLHAVLQLVDRGCPPPLAVRILAPADAPEEAVSR